MNYYELLEITPNASREVVKAAYKVQVAKYHPDNTETGNIAKMQEINIAYETLSDAEKRKKYDESIGIGKAFQDYANDGQDKAKTDEIIETNIVENEQELKERKLTWIASLPIIIIASVIYFPLGVLLFVLRCIILLRNKNIFHRKAKICSTWGVIVICILLVAGMSFLGLDEGESTVVAEKDTQNEANYNIENVESEKNQNTEEEKEVADVEKNTEQETATETIEEEKLETIYNSMKQYIYYENPYYVKGVQEYINFLNVFYESYENNQEVEIVSMDDVLKEAGISRSLRKKILEKEAVSVFTDSEIVRVDEQQEKKLLFSKPNYFEVSSKEKNQIEYDEQGIIFYLGKTRDNKPHGEGALYALTESGVRLSYAGKFKNGRMNGKGVFFACGQFGYCVKYIGNFVDGQITGKGTIYDDGNVTQTYANCLEAYEQVKDKYLYQCTDEQRNVAIEAMIQKYPYLVLPLLFDGYMNSEGIDLIKCKYSVIRPVIQYQGSLKNTEYNGKGTLYGGLGTLWYDGNFKNGAFHGKGTLYYATINIPEYEGEFKKGRYCGKGTVYNEDGSVRKKGQFKNETPNAEWEELERISISNYLEMTEIYGPTLQQIIEKYNLDSSDSLESEDEASYSDTENMYGNDDQVDGEYDEYGEEYDNTPIYSEREYILPASDEEPYSEEDLERQGHSEWECRIARNEIYARYGKIFQDEELQEYFEQMYWYHPSESFSEDELTGVEQHNLDVIVNYEKKWDIDRRG